MERIQQQQDCTNANDSAKDERVPPFAEVYLLNQAVHCWKPIFEKTELRVPNRACANAQ